MPLRQLNGCLALSLTSAFAVLAVSPASADTSQSAASSTTHPKFALEVRPVGTPQGSSLTGSWPQSVVTGDFTGDGRRDVALATGFYNDPDDDAKLFVYPQGADGRLKAPRKLASACSTNLGMEVRRGMDAVDVNRDGRTDLVMASECGVEIFTQRAGVLQRTALLRTNALPRMVKAADMNGDSRPDLAVFLRTMPYSDAPNSTGRLLLLRNTPTGWQRTTLPTDGIYVDRLEAMDVADVTGDRRPDIVLGQHSGQAGHFRVHVLRNTGTGFSVRNYQLPGDGWPQVGGLATGDVTGDGRTDVAVTVNRNTPEAKLHVLRQTADGRLATATVRDVYEMPGAVEVADVNGDRRSDVVIDHSSWDRTGLLLRRSDGTLAATEHLYARPYATFTRQEALAVADVSSDGRKDLVFADYNHGLVLFRQLP